MTTLKTAMFLATALVGCATLANRGAISATDKATVCADASVACSIATLLNHHNTNVIAACQALAAVCGVGIP